MIESLGVMRGTLEKLILRIGAAPRRPAPVSVRSAAGSGRALAALGLALAVAGAACGDPGDAGDGAGWTGAVDTLSNGVVRVSNPARGVWTDAERWSLVEDLRLGTGSGTGPELFGVAYALAVDAEGRMHVLDTQAPEVRVFGPGGRHLGTFGGHGDGPGELQQPRGLAAGPDGRVWIVDLANHRYAVIDSTGNLVDERPRFGQGRVSPWPGTILSDGRVIDVDLSFVDGRPSRTFTLYSSEGDSLATVPVPDYERPLFTHTTDGRTMSAPVPFTGRTHHAWDPEGGLWVGMSEEYRVAHISLQGDTTRVIRRESEPVPVNAAEKDAVVQAMNWFTDQGGRVEKSRIPDEHPAFSRINVDREGYLWVSPTTPRQEEVTAETVNTPRPSVFDVFDPEGRYLGRLRAGLPLIRPVITGSHIYGLTADERGVQYVVRLRIEGR